MDTVSAKHIITSFGSVMSMLGLGELQKSELSAVQGEPVTSGVVIVIGVVGAKKGNIAYTMDMENARRVASSMMMGMPVEEIDDMAKSALSELTNMLAAHTATGFSGDGVLIDISTPTLLSGENVTMDLGYKQMYRIQFSVNAISIDVYFAFDN